MEAAKGKEEFWETGGFLVEMKLRVRHAHLRKKNEVKLVLTTKLQNAVK